MRFPRAVPFLAVLAVSALAPAASAVAAVSVSRDASQNLVINADTNDNLVTLAKPSSFLQISSPTVITVTTSTCSPPQQTGSTFRTDCDTLGLVGISVDLKAGNDTWRDVRPGLTTTTLDADVLGGTGNDVFEGVGGDMNGGANADTLELAFVPFEVGVIARATSTGISLSMPSPPSSTLLQGTVSGVETLRAGSGQDVLNGAAAAAGTPLLLDGRIGADAVIGTDSGDTLIGGNHRDVILGQGGDDSIDAKSGESTAVPDDRIECGAGSADVAFIDLLDPEPAACETVNRSAIGERPHLRIRAPRLVRGRAAGTAARATSRSAVVVALRCPAEVGHRCRGSLRVAARKRGLSRRPAFRYSVPAGKSRVKRLPLSRGQAQGAQRRKIVFLQSIEPGDVRGVKTTTAQRQLRAVRPPVARERPRA